MENMEKEELEQVSGGGRGRGKAVKGQPPKEDDTLVKSKIETDVDPKKFVVDPLQVQAYGFVMPGPEKMIFPAKPDDKEKQ